MRELALKIGNFTVDPAPVSGFKFTGPGVLGKILSSSLDLALYISGALLFIWMGWGIMQYIFAGGNKEALAKARTRIIYALLGFVIVALAFTISDYVKAILNPKNVDITPITSPP